MCHSVGLETVTWCRSLLLFLSSSALSIEVVMVYLNIQREQEGVTSTFGVKMCSWKTSDLQSIKKILFI